MDILKLVTFCVIFLIVYFLNISRRRLVLASVIFLSLSILLNAIADSKIFFQLSTFFEMFAAGSIIGLMFKKEPSDTYQQTKKVYYLFIFFIILQLIHNFWDLGSLRENDLTETLPTVNPWGMLVSFMFVFCYNSRIDINYTEEPSFYRIIIVSSFVFFFMMLLVQFGIIQGNTSKQFDESGGIGLLNRSTNETALIGVCFSIFLLNYIKLTNKPTLYYTIAIIVNIVAIALTKSRVGMISIGVVFFLYFVGKAIKNPVQTIFTTILLAALSLPLMETILNNLTKRNLNDVSIDTDFSTFSDKLGFTLSGRTLIWEAYVDQFFRLVAKAPQLLFWGSGFGSLIEMYKRSFLPLIGFELKRANFFPLHSDFLLIFITSGIVGIVIWLILVFNIIRDLVRKPNFIVAAFCWVLVAFTLFDMLNYSSLCSLLIGLGISNKQKIIYAAPH